MLLLYLVIVLELTTTSASLILLRSKATQLKNDGESGHLVNQLLWQLLAEIYVEFQQIIPRCRNLNASKLLTSGNKCWYAAQ